LNNSQIKAVIFDMDGVLIDAREWHFKALNKSLGLFGMEISLQDHLSRFDGLPTSSKLNILSAERGLPKSLHSLINRLKQAYTVDEILKSCRPVFSKQYALSRLKREGYAIAVASNSIKKTLELMMERSQLLGYLDIYLSNEDVEHPKPGPEIYTKAVSSLGLVPSQVLVVEDNENGVRAATSAGCHLLKVDGPDDVTYWNIIERINQVCSDKP
jgi:beta-phosphoglucomutase-like phosphatase (HAD superfamily)